MHTITYNRIENSIDIRLNPPQAGDVAKVKKFFIDRSYVVPDRVWRIPLDDSQALKVRLADLCSWFDSENTEYQVNQDVYDAIEILENLKTENFKLSQGQTENRLITDKFPGLTPQQVATVEYIFRNARGVINADPEPLDPRLTTWAAIEFGQWLPALVLCSESDRWTWGRMIKETTRRNVLILSDAQKLYREITGEVEEGKTSFNVCVENFGGLESHSGWLASVPWKVIIMDGGHHIKNGTSKTALLIADLFKNLDRRVVLSKTDYKHHPYQLIPQLSIIDRLNDFGSRVEFLKTYNSGWYNNKGAMVDEGIGDPSNLDELEKKLRSTCWVQHEL